MGQLRQALGALRIDQQVPAALVGQRQVEVETRALVVVPGLADERRQEPFQGGHLLDRGLEEECPVGRGQCIGVAEVDLVLRAAELVVRGIGVEAEVGAGVEHPAQHSARVGHGADGVDVAVVVDVAPVAARLRRVRLAQVELELRADHRHQVLGGVLGDGALQHSAGVDAVGAAVHPLEVGDAPGDLRIPGDLRECRGVGPGHDVLESVLEPGDHVVPEVDRHDRLAVGGAVCDQVVEVGDRVLLASRDPVQVGVAEADGGHSLADQLGQLRVGHRGCSVFGLRNALTRSGRAPAWTCRRW